jgi:hypothetical protein
MLKKVETLTMVVMQADGGVWEAQIRPREAGRVLHEAVGGYIEQVPLFDSFNGQPCAAFCDEHGKMKGYPVNQLATLLWTARGQDYLVGDVAVVYGPADLMAEL